ncbi:hypothetical protein F3Y22_tig00116958pilonHSYRG00258 [Hibiscus syriacus]|uniref:TRF2/HOY1 PH-like domain-containing protein n=1 Tax=Hibiscus syriacus TaxID=106335 RepID=A0A6A2WKE3_HIBSY|nr:uncharacterized protein LOC120189630 [Hibiscus syriacus]KAE8660192.1 hypothetical protein F3Y22_tig00116958pilonHSYRG00258 [Hibiscus syriacus]
MEHGELVSGECMKESATLVNGSSSTSPVLGLKLSQTPSFLEKVDQLFLQKGYSFNGEEQADNSSSDGKPKENVLQHSNKLKAENFLISMLGIGSWQRVSRNDGELVGKCYFAKRKLVWEFLENGLKSKIEIQWSDILSLKAVSNEDQPGILELELNQPPVFYHEIDPQPRKHTQWRMVSDFTGGQAPTYRRHYLEFPPGVIDRPLEKLLGYDHRLRMLSRQGFPTLDSPYFPKHTFEGFSLDFGGQMHITRQQQQLSFPNVPTNYQTYQPAPLSSSISGMNVGDDSIPNQIRGSVHFQNNYISLEQDQLGGLVPMQLPSNDHHQSMVFNNSQTGVSNNMAEDDLFMQGHLGNNVVGGGQMYAQVMNWSPDNNSFSSSVITDDFNHDINNWTHDFNFRQWQ